MLRRKGKCISYLPLHEDPPLVTAERLELVSDYVKIVSACAGTTLRSLDLGDNGLSLGMFQHVKPASLRLLFEKD
jgi:hypothetical protein